MVPPLLSCPIYLYWDIIFQETNEQAPGAERQTAMVILAWASDSWTLNICNTSLSAWLIFRLPSRILKIGLSSTSFLSKGTNTLKSYILMDIIIFVLNNDIVLYFTF